jgi:photosystem II stability/assembly factor-like uncharacterized protein
MKYIVTPLVFGVACLVFIQCKNNTSTDSTEITKYNWDKMIGPEGGAVYCFAQNTQGHLFISTNDGIYSSTDHMAAWQKINQGLAGYTYRAIAVGAEGILYCGNDDGGVYTSSNNGAGWNFKIDIGYEVYAIEVNSKDQVFVGGSDGLFKSNDQGRTWQTLEIDGNAVFSIEITANDVLLIGTSNGIYRSSDNGNTWHYLGLNGVEKIAAIVINQQGQIFAGLSDATILRSDDNGATWQWSAAGIPDWASIKSIIINENGEIFAGSEYSGIYLSSDNGISWNQVSTNRYIQSLFIYQTHVLLAGSLYKGLFYSEDGGLSWMQMAVGLNSLAVSTVVFAPNNLLYAGGPHSGIYSCQPDVADWSAVGEALSGYWLQKLAADADGTVYALTLYNGLFRSDDKGRTWGQLNDNWIGNFSTGLAVHHSGVIFCSNGGNIYRSANGSDWFAFEGIHARSFAFGLDDEVYAANDVGIYASTLSGSEWKTLSSDLFSQSMHALATNSMGDIFVGTYSDGVYLSTDEGKSWEKCGLEGRVVNALVVTPEDALFASCYWEGIYYSNNKGKTWQQINDGLSGKAVLVLIEGPDKKIYAGTDGDGIFRCVY